MKQVPAIWFRPDEKLTPKALQTKLQKWLLRLGVVTDDKITGIVTSILALLSEDGHSLPESLQLLEQHVYEVDVLHWHVLPTLTGDGWQGSLKWEGFQFGRLDAQKLVYRCRKAQAMIHEKAAGALDGAPAVWSPILKRKVMDVGRLFWTLKSPAVQKHGASVLEAYLQCMTRLHVEAMWDTVEDAFLLPFALSYPFINLSALRSPAGAETWTCYSGIGLNGTQTWINRDIHLRTERMPRDLSQVQRLLDRTVQRYQIDQLTTSNLYGLLLQVSRSIARSNTHLWSARSDESFLFLIIALEQVFSEKQNTTKAVTRRTAMVVHRALDLTFEEAEKLAVRLYDRRSRLVHDGEVGVATDDLLPTSDFSAETLRCLARLCAKPESHTSDFHEKWLKKLDYMIAGIDAGSSPTDAALVEAGILELKNP